MDQQQRYSRTTALEPDMMFLTETKAYSLV